MSDSATNNKRIAKNTLFLYGRMLLIMAVSLFTSRVVLNTLGVEDFGIYNVVGGVVTLFAFLNGALVTSTQRYLTYELGRNDLKQLRKVFTSSFFIHAFVSLSIVILAETVGLWFVYNKMVIPEGRFEAALWVYHLSIITMVIQVMSVPYNSVIIAYEKMGVFALVSILEASLKLLIVYLLLVLGGDKLVVYAVLMVTVQLLIYSIYFIYCKRQYVETELVKGIDRPLLVEMGKFAGWNIWGNLAATLYSTGLNILLNVFFGPIVNAARGIAVQVESAITQFSTNFLMAVNPQITKLYAQDGFEEMHSLLFRSSKFTCYLLLMISLPVIIETEVILSVWLSIVPDYAAQFIRMLLCIAIIDSMARPLMTAAAATGDVKKYQTVIGGILLGIVPISYVVLKLGGDPVSVYIVYLCVCLIAFFARLFIVSPMIKLSIKKFVLAVLKPCLLVTVSSVILSLLVQRILPNGLFYSIIVCVICVIIVISISYMFGLTPNERTFVNKKVAPLYYRFIRCDKSFR